MNLKNNNYIIYLQGKNFTEKYYKDENGWVKISAKNRMFRMTAEQVLNHLLPVLAKNKTGIILKVKNKI